jgi:DNA-binding transcriptional ArsR family regulator
VRPEALAGAAPVFAALGDQTRLGIVARLGAEGPLPVTRLAAGHAMSRQAISKHLAVLARSGLVRDSRQGRERVWALDPEPLLAASECLGLISAQWDDALARLRQLVEEPEARPAP